MSIEGDPTAPLDDRSAGSSAAVPAPVPAAGMAGIERAFLRLTFWQTLLSLAGVFTGAVALYAALTESQAVREQTAASVWPRLQVLLYEGRGSGGEGGDQPLRVQFRNVGVGPALVGNLRLRVGGDSVRSWRELVAVATEGTDVPGEGFGQETVSRRVLAPGETIVAFSAPSDALADAMLRLFRERGAVLSYCYCSIFDQCWLHHDEAGGTSDVTPVAACPDFGADNFSTGDATAPP